MGRNEQQTRFDLIDPKLFDRGWTRADIRVEETAAAVDVVYGKGKRRPKGRTDYVLRRPLLPDTEPVPLAIIEAKREDLAPGHGLQQAKNYRIGHLHHVPFVFSSNGHQFVEYAEDAGITSEASPMDAFPKPEELIARYLKHRDIEPASKDIALLTTPYAQGRDYLRYYQDAAVRAATEKVIAARAADEPPRVLLSLATGAGKTRIAAVLLRRLFDAGAMGRALFVCDRTELRDNGLGDFQALFGNDAAEVDARHAQKNARVLVATYQTLDQDLGPDGATFFSDNYPPDYFDVVIIDECHRSAWGDWNRILTSNENAIQIGLTATPRELKLPDVEDDAEIQAQVESDRRFLSDNYRYFGDPVYEYSYLQGVADGYLAPADIETYDLFHDGRRKPERMRGVKRKDIEKKKLTNFVTGQAVPPKAVAETNQPGSLEQRLVMPDRVKTMCAHLFGRILANGDGDPLQKTIIFCAGDHHADLVTNEMGNLYSQWWRKANGKRRVQTYAFKCMASTNGQTTIPDFRGRSRSHIIATTKDLLTTGVNIPCVRNIVFFRYINSPILFLQMVGRGTRIEEESGKLIFRVLDYTGATDLFGKDLIVPPPPQPGPEGPKPPPPPAPISVKGVQVDVKCAGNYNLIAKDGRLSRVSPEEYRQHLVEELTALVPSLSDFRTRWLEPSSRQEMMDQLASRNLLPDTLRASAHMEEFDEFDVLAAFAYGVKPLTRAERAGRFSDSGPAWLVELPAPSATVIRAVVHQFERAGTESLETPELWEIPGIRDAHGLRALREGGDPAQLLRQMKEELFAA